MRRLLVALALLAPVPHAHGAAGEFVFSLNRVELQRGEAAIPALRGLPFEPGDTVTTGPMGYAQLRFRDGQLLALKPGASLKIEAYALPEAETVAAGQPLAAPVVAPADRQALGATVRRSVLRLLKGTMRAASGLIGKHGGDDYRVLTPVASLGIRGTDYGMAMCQGDCPGHADGLYVGVSSGAVVLWNDVSEIVLRDGEHAYVKDSGTPIEQQLEPPEILEIPIGAVRGSDDDDGATAAPRSGSGPAARSGAPAGPDVFEAVTANEDPEGEYELPPVQPLESAAYAAAQPVLAGATPNGAETIAPISASAANQGFDPATGISWARWSGGAVAVAGVPQDFSVGSLHVVSGPQSYAAPVLPAGGTLNYTLAGNTDPTDQNGNAGYLIGASLSANFSAMTVTSALDLGLGGQLWQASGAGSIASGTALFDGSYTVSVDGVPGASGLFSGFFTSGATGAGLGFSLTDGITSVSGAATFNNPVAP